MILIKDGRVIDPKRGIDDVLDVLIEGKKIKKIGKPKASQTINNNSNNIITVNYPTCFIRFRFFRYLIRYFAV